MNQQRKDELYDKMFTWICEHCRSDRERFQLFHGQFGMTKEELHEHNIENLDRWFPEVSARTRLKQRFDDNLAEYRERWLKLEPAALIEQCEEVEAVTRLARTFLFVVTEEDAEHLLRFRNPLGMLSDEWIRRNGIDALISSAMDRGGAKEAYEEAPNARVIAEHLIRAGTESTSTGNWIFSFEEINEHYHTSLPGDKKLLDEISRFLYSRSDSVADVCITEEGIDLDFYYGQCPNYSGDEGGRRWTAASSRRYERSGSHDDSIGHAGGPDPPGNAGLRH